MKTSFLPLVVVGLLVACSGGSSKTDGGTSANNPPSIALTDASPRYQQQTLLTFTATVKASSGSTVTSAFAASSGPTPVQGTAGANGLYTFTNVPVATGANTVNVWAEDNAGHSGKTSAPPYHASLQVIVDASAPNLAVDASIASYFDERNVGLVNDGGVPAMPAQYAFPASTAKVVIDATHPVYKVASRLAAGASLVASALESDNPSNTPFLRFTAPFVAASEAPISVTFSATSTCSGAGCDGVTFTDTGTLLPSAQSDAQNALFDLPLSSESLSALAKLPVSPAHVVITLTATDAAGNASSPLTLPGFDFHVLGAPITSREDTGYPQAADARSIHPYTLGNGNYGYLWTGSNDGEIGRALRYVLYNASTLPVAVGLAASGNDSIVERWDTVNYETPDTGSWCNSVNVCKPTRITWIDESSGNCPSINTPFNPTTQYAKLYANGGDFSATALPYPSAFPVTGDPKPYTNTVTLVSARASSAGEPTAPSVDSKFVVPAASGLTPGSLVLYVGREWMSSHHPVLTYAAPTGLNAPQGYYDNVSAFAYWFKGSTHEGGSCSPNGDYHSDYFYGFVVLPALALAQEHLTGTSSITPFALTDGGTTTLGEAGPVTSSPFDETFVH